MTTSKIARRGDMIQERRNYEHDSVNYPDPAFDWCVTRLAVQFRLGLLAQRRIRFDSFDFNYPRFDGTPLSTPVCFAGSRHDALILAPSVRNAIFEDERVSAFRNFFISLRARLFSFFVFDTVQSEGTNKSKSRI